MATGLPVLIFAAGPAPGLFFLHSLLLPEQRKKLQELPLLFSISVTFKVASEILRQSGWLRNHKGQRENSLWKKLLPTTVDLSRQEWRVQNQSKELECTEFWGQAMDSTRTILISGSLAHPGSSQSSLLSKYFLLLIFK